MAWIVESSPEPEFIDSSPERVRARGPPRWAKGRLSSPLCGVHPDDLQPEAPDEVVAWHAFERANAKGELAGRIQSCGFARVLCRAKKKQLLDELAKRGGPATWSPQCLSEIVQSLPPIEGETGFIGPLRDFFYPWPYQ